MKIRIHFKTNDALSYALNEACGPEITSVGTQKDEDDITARDTAKAACEEFVEYGENCTIEIDSETKTAVVVKR